MRGDKKNEIFLKYFVTFLKFVRLISKMRKTNAYVVCKTKYLALFINLIIYTQ